MKILFYPRLALSGIQKNRQLYLPYFLTCSGMVMMFYLLCFLSYSKGVSGMALSAFVASILRLGSIVIAVFSCAFLFYTNAFFLRRRKKEFGLYSILGMNRRNLGRILFWESAFLSLSSLAAGLLGGIAFSKLAELGLLNILKGEIDYTLRISPQSVLLTLKVFGVIFLLIFFNALRQLWFSSAIALFSSEQAGEKPPKANWALGLLGVAILGCGYYIAIAYGDNAITAIEIFFTAVLLVMAGTWLTMIFGSVLLCRLLQKNRAYYYRPAHFVSVASMAWRMKRNGAGLASICILSTMVLVMISSTACLYFGTEDALQERYPGEINLEVHLNEDATADLLSDSNTAAFLQKVRSLADDMGTEPKNLFLCREVSMAGTLTDGHIAADLPRYRELLDSSLTLLSFIPLSDYNALTGSSETLKEDEILLGAKRMDYQGDTLSFFDKTTCRIKRRIDDFYSSRERSMSILPGMTIVVPDIAPLLQNYGSLAEFTGNRAVSLQWTCHFDTDLDANGQASLSAKLLDAFLSSPSRERFGIDSVLCETRIQNRNDFFTMHGGLFYLGIMLSLVFLTAAVLMIYYKQICEGYEDSGRFAIMQKVGMTRREIKRSVNSQLLTVFFLPLAFSALHLCFSFPIISTMLHVFNLSNTALLGRITAVCFALFALFYLLIYRITSNTYYRIVSGLQET